MEIWPEFLFAARPSVWLLPFSTFDSIWKQRWYVHVFALFVIKSNVELKYFIRKNETWIDVFLKIRYMSWRCMEPCSLLSSFDDFWSLTVLCILSTMMLDSGNNKNSLHYIPGRIYLDLLNNIRQRRASWPGHAAQKSKLSGCWFESLKLGVLIFFQQAQVASAAVAFLKQVHINYVMQNLISTFSRPNPCGINVCSFPDVAPFGTDRFCILCLIWSCLVQ